MDSLGRTAAIVIAVVLLFLFPLRYDAASQEQTAHSYQVMELDHFWHDISTERKLTRQRYQQFCEALGNTDFAGTIVIERYQPVIYTTEAESIPAESGTENEALSLSDATVTNYEYDNLIELLASEEEVTLSQGEYITIYLRQETETVIEKLQNLLLPFYLYSSEYQTGGRIN